MERPWQRRRYQTRLGKQQSEALRERAVTFHVLSHMRPLRGSAESFFSLGLADKFRKTLVTPPDLQGLIATVVAKSLFSDVLAELNAQVAAQGVDEGGLVFGFVENELVAVDCLSPTGRQDFVWQTEQEGPWIQESFAGPRSIGLFPWQKLYPSHLMPSRAQWALRLMIMEDARRSYEHCMAVSNRYLRCGHNGYVPIFRSFSSSFARQDVYRMAKACITAKLFWQWSHQDAVQMVLRGAWVSVGYHPVSETEYNTFLRVVERPPVLGMGDLAPLLWQYDKRLELVNPDGSEWSWYLSYSSDSLSSDSE